MHTTIVMAWNHLQRRLKPTGSFMSLMHISPETLLNQMTTPHLRKTIRKLMLYSVDWAGSTAGIHVCIDASCGVCAPVSSLKGFVRLALLIYSIG